PPAVTTRAPSCPVPNLAVRLSGGSGMAGARTSVLVQLRNRSQTTAARHVVLRYRLPAGATLASLPAGSRLTGGVLVHRIAAIGPRGGRDLRIPLRLAKDATGTARHHATVTAECGGGKSTRATVRMRALPVQVQPAVAG
ncbi:MAG TPA: hypothetical protein VNT51_05550, partial [Miltoncostaeaceae bacterium]|nr:hypothetical protein [Miltoncostaeaceae bacterium]